MRIKTETAIITGASSGLGAEMARQLAKTGVKLGLTARREPELKSLAQAIHDDGGTAFIAPADAADADSTRAAFASLIERLGPIDLLIANAGVGLNVTAAKFSAEKFDKMTRVNLIGVAYAIEAVLPNMRERRRGQIVGISSLASYRGLPGSAGYSATKAGLSSLLEGLRAESGGSGVTFTTVNPGFVRTPMTAGAKHGQPFMMEVEPAARLMLRGISRGKRRIDFPWPMVALLTGVSMMPGWLYDRLANRLVNS